MNSPPLAMLPPAARRAESLHRRRKLPEACLAFSEAVARTPENGAVRHLYALALRACGQVDAATEQFKTAVVLGHGPAAMESLAETLLQAGRLDEAEACLQALLPADPKRAATWRGLAEIVLARGQPEHAAAFLREALARAPDDHQSLRLFGLAGLRMGYADAARTWLMQAQANIPPEHDALCALADAFCHAGMWEGAVALYDRALTLEPRSIPALCNKAGALLPLGRAREALAALRRADALQPNTLPVLTVMVAALRNTGALEDAERLSARVLAMAPISPLARSNAAMLLLDRGRFDEALTAIRAVLADTPDDVEMQRFEAFTLLLLGRLPEGFARLESRLRLAVRGRDFDAGVARPAPRWAGGDVAGTSILMTAEEGFGDTIQFVRYARILAGRGARVGVRVQPGLCRVMQGAAYVSAVHAEGDVPDGYDAEVPMLSLPHLLGSDLDNIPGDTPYLHVPDMDVQAWRARLGDDGALKVGLVWAGNPLHSNDHNRSIPWQTIRPLTQIPGLHFHSLQVGPSGQECARDAGRITDLTPHITDYLDTAAAILALDLVISVDTSVTHLAGALGAPIWTLLPLAPDWRWMLGRDDSPWYPSMRLFRQTSVGDWAGVIKRIAAALEAEKNHK